MNHSYKIIWNNMGIYARIHNPCSDILFLKGTLSHFVSRPMTGSNNGVKAFALECTDCAFTTTVEDDVDGVFDVIEAHQSEMHSSQNDHFVNFEAISE